MVVTSFPFSGVFKIIISFLVFMKTFFHRAFPDPGQDPVLTPKINIMGLIVHTARVRKWDSSLLSCMIQINRVNLCD